MGKVWFSTATGNGIGASTAKTARAGDRVVATGRYVQRLRNALHDVASRSHLAFARPAGFPGGTALAMFMDSMTRCCGGALHLVVSDVTQAVIAFDQAVKSFGLIAWC